MPIIYLWLFFLFQLQLVCQFCWIIFVKMLLAWLIEIYLLTVTEPIEFPGFLHPAASHSSLVMPIIYLWLFFLFQLRLVCQFCWIIFVKILLAWLIEKKIVDEIMKWYNIELFKYINSKILCDYLNIIKKPIDRWNDIRPSDFDITASWVKICGH
jgi:hypothetical protein